MPRNKISLSENTYVLDARPDRIDTRDRPYRPPLVSLPTRWPTLRDIDLALPHFTKMVDDQGTEGACTGFGLAAVINYILWRDTVLGLPRNERGLLAVDLDQVVSPIVSPYQLYHLAQIYDEWEGEDYEGSSCRGAVKGFHKHGVCTKQLWPEKKSPEGDARITWQRDAASRPLGSYYRVNCLSINDIQSAIYEVGAVYASANVHAGWQLDSSPDKLPVISKSSTMPFFGAHAFAIIGYNTRGFIVQNSWGPEWGYNGFALLPYDDWATSALDAWVAVLGAPMAIASHGNTTNQPDETVPAITLHSYRTDSLSLASTRNPKWYWDSSNAERSTAPLSPEESYGLTVVLGNNGQPIRRRVGFDNAADAVNEIAFDLPKKWFENVGNKRSNTLKLLLYCHGGLNSESDSLKRISRMAPYFLANGIYPIFLTWRTSFWNSITGILDDSIQNFLEDQLSSKTSGWVSDFKKRFSEAKDRAVEVACQNLLVKPIWTQMKQNAEAAIARGSGLYTTLQCIEKLFSEIGECELHLIGHSAGAFPTGYVLKRLQARNMVADSCRLFAPACTADFANDRFGTAFQNEVLSPEKFYLHVLSDKLEREDSVSVYGKSLLYLVSRALEANHKEPLLGLEYLHETDSEKVPDDFWHVPVTRRRGDRTNLDVQKWQETFLPLLPEENINIHREPDIATKIQPDGAEVSIKQNHGSFDNNIHLITDAISQIKGQPASPTATNLDCF